MWYEKTMNDTDSPDDKSYHQPNFHVEFTDNPNNEHDFKSNETVHISSDTANEC